MRTFAVRHRQPTLNPPQPNWSESMNVSSITRTIALAATFAAGAVTAPAVLAGPVQTAGELTVFDPPAMVSTLTREQVVADTLAAIRNGDLASAGEGYDASDVASREALAASTRTRAERKAETLLAAQTGQLMRAGEAG